MDAKLGKSFLTWCLTPYPIPTLSHCYGNIIIWAPLLLQGEKAVLSLAPGQCQLEAVGYHLSAAAT